MEKNINKKKKKGKTLVHAVPSSKTPKYSNFFITNYLK